MGFVCRQALDTFNTAVVSPIYYALFTSFTILASAIMFKVCSLPAWYITSLWHSMWKVALLLCSLGLDNMVRLYLTQFSVQDYSGQSISSIASELCGFITVLSGTTILHTTRDPDKPFITGMLCFGT